MPARLITTWSWCTGSTSVYPQPIPRADPPHRCGSSGSWGPHGGHADQRRLLDTQLPIGLPVVAVAVLVHGAVEHEHIGHLHPRSRFLPHPHQVLVSPTPQADQ